jgi:E3 ubiquitin-protein ligase HERC1
MMLRAPHGTRPFRVKFSGEGGIDAGGLGRELLSEVCSTLQSRDTPLFIPVPNAAGFGDHSNAWIPNPASTSSLHLSMYAFVGKFMGMSIRGGQVLNLDLPPVIWKLLIAANIGRQDIQEINALAFKVLDQYAAPSLDEEAFNQLPVQHFVTLSSDGREVELKEGGANIPVTFSTREEYVRLEEHYRLHEFDVAIAHMRKGLATIVPVHLLSLFTHLEVETMVCGSREISIDMLKRHTEYQRGIRPSDPHVKHLWKVLEEMSQAERQLFLRFVSGQSRLWSDERDAVKFKLMPAAVDNDITLPVSHTCFFSLELPRSGKRTRGGKNNQ